VTAARGVIRDALTFHLNRLSPGEAEDADLFNRCIDALNNIADELNGGKSFLWREIISTATITGASGTLGTDWTGLASGDEILGATITYSTGLDIPLRSITLGQYANIAIKAITTLTEFFAHDGAAAVYFYPAVPTKPINLRTKQVMSAFADLDTDYVMPKGYRSALSALLAEKMAPTLAPELFQTARASAMSARSRLAAQASNPAIISAGDTAGPLARVLRGY
jgi:hypothetical protein